MVFCQNVNGFSWTVVIKYMPDHADFQNKMRIFATEMSGDGNKMM